MSKGHPLGFLSRKELLLLLVAVLGSRILLTVVAIWTAPSSAAIDPLALSRWERWDALHYIRIATDGYNPPDLDIETKRFMSRFPPLYPYLVRLVVAATYVSYNTAGIVLNWLLFTVAATYLFLLARRETNDDRLAWFSVLFLSLHPGSFFVNAAYSEALFLAISAAYFYSIRFGGDLLRSAVLASGLVLTRTAGLTLLPLHLLVVSRSVRESGFSVRQVIAAALPFLSFGVFHLLTTRIYQLPGYLGYETNRGGATQLNLIPLTDAAHNLRHFFENVSGALNDEFFLETVGWSNLSLLLTIGAIAAAWKHLAVEYRLYSVCYLLLLSLIDFNIASVRYTFALLPLYLALPHLRFRVALLCLSAVILLNRSEVWLGGGWCG